MKQAYELAMRIQEAKNEAADKAIEKVINHSIPAESKLLAKFKEKLICAVVEASDIGFDEGIQFYLSNTGVSGVAQDVD